MRIRIEMVAFVAVLLLGFVGGTAHRSDSQALPSLAVYSEAPEILDDATPYYAQALGYFRDEGVDVTIGGCASDNVCTAAIASGSADVAIVGLPGALNLVEKGAAQIIGTDLTGYPYRLLANQSVKSIKDLEGKNLAVSSPGAISHILPMLLLQKNGGDESKVHIIPIGGVGARVAALLVGKVDATIAIAWQIPDILAKAPNLHEVMDIAGALPNFVQTVLVASTPALKSKSPAIAAYLAAEIRTLRWMHANPNEAAKLGLTYVPETSLKTLQYGYSLYAKNHSCL